VNQEVFGSLKLGVVQDQFYYAHRLRKLGIAPAGISVRKLTA